MPTIKISDIDLENSVQIRVKIDPDTVADYAAHIQARKPPLPPIIVFGPDSRGKFFLSEGWHRLEANRRAGRADISATIKDGGWKDALEHALGSNAAHGLRRTNADKRRAIELALKHWPGWSSRAVAEKCGVDEITVRRFRCGIPAPETVTGRDGKQYPAHPPMRQTQVEQDQPREVVGPDEVYEEPGTRPEVPLRTSQPPTPPPEPSAPKPIPDAELGALPKDAKGRPIPPTCLPLWTRRQEVLALLSAVSEVRTTLKGAQEDRDPLWCGKDQGGSCVNFSSVLAHLNQVYADIKAALPHRICPVCQGLGCRHCCGLGLISEYRLGFVPSEFK